MATGSAAAARAKRDAAGYHTGQYQKLRCDQCKHVVNASTLQRTKYDRSCTLHGCLVKTHGTCGKWSCA